MEYCATNVRNQSHRFLEINSKERLHAHPLHRCPNCRGASIVTRSARPLRVAVVGAAGWAGSRHARAFAKAGASVTHLVEKDERAALLAPELGAQVVPPFRSSLPMTWTWPSWRCPLLCNPPSALIC